MNTIEIDFEVFKELTARRKSEAVSENDVLRDVLGLPPKRLESRAYQTINPRDWMIKGVTFPEGTEFRATYKGRTYTAHVEGGALVLDGKRHPSPSAAAVSITGSAVNGWRFWEARLPGQSGWKVIESLRRPRHVT
jgi:hypothetical protein